LSQQAEKTKASMIAFSGVHFMAETAKILNPDKKLCCLICVPVVRCPTRVLQSCLLNSKQNTPAM